MDSLPPPFFRELVKYAQDGSYSWHCPGHSGGVAFLKSPVGQMFHQFFGENMLRADVCNAVDELGQLLDHTGPVAESELNAARIFHADHCYFVTNGTSTSNRWWHANVAAGDVVVVDRNCHKSILHAITMTGAIPVFLRPTRNHLGIIGPIPLEEFHPDNIRKKIEANPFAREAVNKNPRILTLTQSTYDGVIYNVEMIKEQLAATSTRCTSTKPGCRTRRSTSSTRTCTRSARTARAARTRWCSPRTPRTSCWPASQASQIIVQESETRKLDRNVFNEAYLMHVHVAAVRDHRVLRRGRRHDGAARRHRAGRGEHPRSHGLPPRHAQGGIRIRQERLVVQGLGPNRLCPKASAIAMNGFWNPMTTGMASATWPKASTCWTRSRPRSSPRAWTCPAASARPASRPRWCPST